MTSRPKDPDRLHLRRVTSGTTYLIIYKKRMIGQVESIPRESPDKNVWPSILLEKPFSPALCDRIRDLVNKRDGTNRNIEVRSAPRRDHPAILKFLKGRRLTW